MAGSDSVDTANPNGAGENDEMTSPLASLRSELEEDEKGMTPDDSEADDKDETEASGGSMVWGAAPEDDDDDEDDEEDVGPSSATPPSKNGGGSSTSRPNAASALSMLLSENAKQVGSQIAETEWNAAEPSTSVTPAAADAALNESPALVESHVAIRVIKGEIHNVLTVMRSSEQRYISPLRFTEELPEDLHPVVQQFQDLHAELCEWDVQMALPVAFRAPRSVTQDGQTSTVVDYYHDGPPDTLLYVPPFCAAISTREMSAPVTGAALSALHKFLLYGFVNAARDAHAGMALIAEALLNCTFEESNSSSGGMTASNAMGSALSQVTGMSSGTDGATSGGSQGLTLGRGGKPLQSRFFQNSNRAARNQPYYHPAMVDDEQVVLKLLDLAAMVVRCSFSGLQGSSIALSNPMVTRGKKKKKNKDKNLADTPLIQSDTVVGLLDTCLHVSHIAKSASPLLKSAATDALAEIVLQVFAGPSHVLSARKDILVKLANMLNPAKHSEEVIVSSLTAVNIALETSRENLTKPEITILQNDLCKFLLQWSTTSDLLILSLTLRVIFNLFQSIQNHLKVPLEVFLTSVHLRILENTKNSSSNEEREVVLESILEFCQEPILMQDIYRNYDCDVACSNLYELIISALGKVAMPDSWLGSTQSTAQTETSSTTTLSTNGSNKDVAGGTPQTPAGPGTAAPTAISSSSAAPSQPQSMLTISTSPSPVNQLNRLALEGILANLSSIARRVHADRSPYLNTDFDGWDSIADITEGMDSSLGSLTEEELTQQRQRKNNLMQVVSTFNEDPMGKEWLEMAVNLDILESTENAKGAAKILFMSSNVDKTKLGLYLSKGPDEQYPFNAAMREFYVQRYDFESLPFAGALRLYLSKFRLPGEAQCIDRLMESFSKQLFKQQSDNNAIFKNSDAVYVLAFSTIMLNTDLHNPMIKEKARMTREQFVKNNRGINSGEDIPLDFLNDLYDQIKEHEIQVPRGLTDFIKKQDDDEDFRTAWDSILAKHTEVATASFTPAGMARKNIFRAGVHDKEMFAVLSKWALQCIPAVLRRSWDDTVVVKCIRGLKQMALIADHFDMDPVVNDVIEVLLFSGRDYVVGVITSDHQASLTLGQTPSSRNIVEESEAEDTTTGESEFLIPYSLLSTGKGYTEIDYTGAANHRGLLALDTGFLLVRRYARKVMSAWPVFIECLCAMRDARALPAGLSDLDDFADSNGNVLPLSIFALNSQKRLDRYYQRKAARYRNAQQQDQSSWFQKLFKTKDATVTEATNARHQQTGDSDSSEATKALLAVAEAANVEKIVQMGSTKLPVAEQTIRSLLDVVDDYPYDDDPVAEQHSIFSLELAARALLSNRERAAEIFPLFLTKFEHILGRTSEKNVPSPFVIERIVVTILRCSIHLYDIPELRPNLRVSLHLLVMSIPRNFMREIADRMACGLAIILRASFQFFESHNEWTFMGDTMDTLANFAPARVFVFDGIASTVECALPQYNEIGGPGIKSEGHEEKVEGEEGEEDDVFVLTKEACGALSRILIRFVLGFYQSDTSLSVPATVCLEKVYRHMNSLLVESEAEAEGKVATEKQKKTRVPNKDYWQNVVVALYSVCRSPDPEVSRHGYESCQRIILRTSAREIPDEKWIAILYLMVNKQPPTASALSRSNTFVLLGNMLIRVLPYLSRKEDNIEDLQDMITQTATLGVENLENGRRGRGAKPLFDKTVQTVNYLSKHMSGDDWKGNKEFGTWASETLLGELKKAGVGRALDDAASGPVDGIPEAPREDDDDDEDDDEEEEEEEG